MKYFSSTPLVFLTVSLLFFSYAVNRFAEASQVSWITIGIGVVVLISGGIYSYVEYQRHKE